MVLAFHQIENMIAAGLGRRFKINDSAGLKNFAEFVCRWDEPAGADVSQTQRKALTTASRRRIAISPVSVPTTATPYSPGSSLDSSALL